MTLEKARQLLEVQAGFGGGYSRNGALLVLAEVAREHGAERAEELLRELRLEQRLGIAPDAIRRTKPSGTRNNTPS